MITSDIIRLADDERLGLLLVGGTFERNSEQAASSSRKSSKLLKPPPTSFSAGADLIKVTS